MNETSFLGKLVPNSFILPQIIENGNFTNSYFTLKFQS